MWNSYKDKSIQCNRVKINTHNTLRCLWTDARIEFPIKVFLISNAQTIIYINIWILTQLIPSVCKIYFDIGHRLKYKNITILLSTWSRQNLLKLGKKINKLIIKGKPKKLTVSTSFLFSSKMMLRKCKTKLYTWRKYSKHISSKIMCLLTNNRRVSDSTF